MKPWTSAPLRPLAEGVNIGNWVGFKHFAYLAHAGVDRWLRARGYRHPARHETSTHVDVDRMALTLRAPLYRHSQVTVQVAQAGSEAARGPLGGPLSVEGVSEDDRIVMAGTVDLRAHDVDSLRAALRTIANHPPPDRVQVPQMATAAFTWSQPLAYYHCAASALVTFDAYVRLVEEGIDRFLSARGLPVAHLLATRSWIPVVTSFDVTVHARAYMGEHVSVAVHLEDVRDVLWTGRLEFFVPRHGAVLHVATARITHGYVPTRGPGVGRLVPLGNEVKDALARGVDS